MVLKYYFVLKRHRRYPRSEEFWWFLKCGMNVGDYNTEKTI